MKACQTLHMQDYFKIRLNSMHPSGPLTFDVFLRLSDRHVHYLRQGDHFTQEKLASFKDKAPDSFFVPMEQRQAYKDFVHDCIAADLPSVDKALILRESSLALIEEIFETPDVATALDQTKDLVDEFVGFMGQEPEAISHLISLSSHDFYTYNHSLDVGIYCLGLGKAVGFNEKDIKELGQGAILHDIGKRNVSVDIICKNGPLDDVEWAQMQKHPQYGLQILNEFDVSDEIKACCFEHHESFLGNGYPQQLDGDEIHPMARIVAITDTYDALTTKRSYNQPMTPKDALNFMNQKLANRYDPDMMKAMYSVLFKMEKQAAG